MGDLLKIYKKIIFIRKKHMIQENLILFCTEYMSVITYQWGMETENSLNCFNTHKTNAANLENVVAAYPYISKGFICLFVCLFIYLFVYLFIYLFIYYFIHLYLYLFTALFIYLFIYFYLFI